ncbi:MAG TPA: sialidase family protein [Streptosporangiaceae bacterium]
MTRVRLLAVTFLAGACAVLGPAAPPALAASSGAGPVTDVSGARAGQNAEAEQAVAPPRYAYEAWIGCGGEGFARPVDGGRHFSAPVTLPDSGGSDDPAVAVAPDGTVYVSCPRYRGSHAYPVVAASFDRGAAFSRASSPTPHVAGNWGDRDFIAAGRGGTAYVTWDYGPGAADVKIVCSPAGSCAYGAVDATAVIQKSTDHGKTWGPITPMQPGFPAGGGSDASVLVQPGGVVDALMLDHPLDPGTFAVHPGHGCFTSSSDGGRTWSPAVGVGGSAGSIAILTWRIDGDLSTDRAGNLYAPWDTQTSSGDIGWLSYSTGRGRAWSAPVRVTADQDNAVHNVESAGAGPGVAGIAWQAGNSPQGYAAYLRPFSVRRGWPAPVTQVSGQYGNPAIWPGDPFGISVLPGQHGPGAPEHVALSWGSAVAGSQNSEIYATVAGR